MSFKSFNYFNFTKQFSMRESRDVVYTTSQLPVHGMEEEV